MITCTNHNTHTVGCKPCQLALGRAVYEAWQETPSTGVPRAVLVEGRGSDQLDTKGSLSLLYYLLKGCAPSAPSTAIAPSVMAHHLGLDTDTFNKRIAAAFAKGAAAYFLALRSSEEPSDGHRKTEGGLEEEKDPFEMIRWDTFLEQRAFELIETEGKCEEQKAFDAVAPRILPTVGVAAHVPTSDRARAVRQLWQEAPDYSVELHILSHSGDKMDMKQSLALVHFMLVGSDPSLPDVRLSPEEMARRLGFSTRVLHARLNAIVRMGREAYLQALSKSTSPFLSQP